MKKYIYIVTITYNYEGGYVAKKCDTYEEAVKLLNDFLKEEVQTVRTECGYTPSVLEWGEDDITLVYADGYSEDDLKGNYNSEDCVYYRIFEVEI